MQGYKTFGAMLDCSRDGVLTVEEVKRFAKLLSSMGYDTLMLYTEDTYEVEGEPWFGYMRGGYTTEELRSLDRYLRGLGMELIPCIQTLAHFTTLSRLPHYEDVVDIDDILLVGEEKTYKLIDAMFSSLEKAFSSRTVHIGMDEAHHVGLGKYLDKHGFSDRSELLVEHLKRVCAIAKAHGFHPVMWSDMFFRLAHHGEYGPSRLPEKEKALIPEDVSLVYWDYYHMEESWYDTMLDAHLETGREVWFAGGAWSWMGFAPMNGYAVKTMTPAMRSVKKKGIDRVLITLWGDNGKECSYNSVLPALHEIACRARGVEDESVITEEFSRLVGVQKEEFLLLDLPNHRREGQPFRNENLCKSLFYSDPFTGYFDGALTFPIDYKGYSEKLERAHGGGFRYLFDAEAKLCRFLELKSHLGVQTRKAYKNRDTKELLRLGKEVYPRAAERLMEFYTAFRALWLRENKPFGLEVHEARMGGVMLRLRSCGERLVKYAEGSIDRIEELECEPLPITTNGMLWNNVYTLLATFGVL